MNVEIVCIGNELLIGKTINTNAAWIAKRVTTLGGGVKTIISVGDKLLEIERGVKQALSQKPRFILTTGGLGPTFDDMTLEGVAQALDRRTMVNEEALRLIREKYEAYQREGRIERVDITPPREKMAHLPEGGTPIPNPVGTAPGVIISFQGTLIFCLPGVPSEMKAIFDESIASIISSEGGLRFYERTFKVDGIMESTIAPLIDKVMNEIPSIYIKSHPLGEERKPFLDIHLSTRAKNAEEADFFFTKTEKMLWNLIQIEKQRNKF